MKSLLCFLCATAALAGVAHSYPEGAPWGAANPDSAQSCASCHFDYDPERDSSLVSLTGIPDSAASGETYQLTVALAPSEAVIAGFMLSASAGAFHHAGKGMEANEQDVRSVVPASAQGGASWSVTWTAPEKHKGEVVFYLAVNGANDDMSAFGDRVYFNSFILKMGE